MMNERVFLAFRGLAIQTCFPGLGPSERHTSTCVLCLLVNQKLALRWIDISTQPYEEATPQSKTPPSGLLGGDPTRVVDRSSPLSTRDVAPEWVYRAVYLPLAVPHFRFTYVSLDILSQSPPYSRPFPVLPRTARCC